jgi:Spx/MgsR family transcriptional regulator
MPRKAAPKKAATKRSAKPRKRAARTRKTSVKSARGKSVQFLQKPSCTSCRNARAYMEKRGFKLNFRDLDKHRLSAAELEDLIGDRDHTEFLNTRNELYRAKNMKQHPPSRAEAIRMMAETPNLIRRPVIVAGGRIVLGFDQNGIDSI